MTTLDARARQEMLVAANAGGGHPNILGLVQADPLIEIEEKLPKIIHEGKEIRYSHDAIVMPIAPGDDFLQYAESDSFGQMTIRDQRTATQRFFAQMIAGVQHLHKLGIVHLDLKLENMLLDQKSVDARLMIMDFGMADVVPAKGDNAGRLGRQFTGGDPRYAAPEARLHRSRGNFAVDNTDGFAADVWCLGVCLSNLLLAFGTFDTFDEEVHTMKPMELFTKMRDEQGRGENGLRYVCSVSKQGDSAVKRFNALPSELQSLLDGMLRVNPKERLKLGKVADEVAKSSWVAGTPESAQRPRRAAASEGRVRPQGTTWRSMSAADDEAEEPRLNACSALPDDSAASGVGYRGLSALADVSLEEDKPPKIRIGRGYEVWVL
jgi:serine/threonine protein kinase